MEGVSVIIPCYNEEKYIKDCVKGLLSNGFDINKFEIIIVDGGSSDNTLNIISELVDLHSNVRIINNPKRKTPFALNIGVQNAKYNYILIAGAHAEYPLGYISSLYELIQKPEIDVVGGVIETKAKTDSKKTRAIVYVLSHKLGVGNSIFRIGAKELLQVDTVPFGMYNKSVFEKVGYYNEYLIRNHDMELSSRIKQAGFKIWMDPELKCTYFARETFMGLAKNNYGNGFWNLKTLRITKKFGSLGIRHYIPLIFVLSLIIPLISAVFSHFALALVSAASLFSYTLVVIPIALKAHGIKFYLLIWAFITLHFSYGLGSLVGLIAIKKSH